MASPTRTPNGWRQLCSPGQDEPRLARRLDRLIESLSASVPKPSSEAELVSLGDATVEAILRVALDIAPVGTHDGCERKLTPRSKRLLERTQRVLSQMMPQAGITLHRTLQEMVAAKETESASRLIWYTTPVIADQETVATYSEIVSNNLLPEVSMQIVVDLATKYDVTLSDLTLTGRCFKRPQLLFSDILRGLELSRSVFDHAWFQSVDLSNCNLAATRFIECSFPGTI